MPLYAPYLSDSSFLFTELRIFLNKKMHTLYASRHP